MLLWRKSKIAAELLNLGCKLAAQFLRPTPYDCITNPLKLAIALAKPFIQQYFFSSLVSSQLSVTQLVIKGYT